jgi:hypothetical protein
MNDHWLDEVVEMNQEDTQNKEWESLVPQFLKLCGIATPKDNI